MKKSECYQAGFVRRTSGLKGEVVIQLDVDEPARYRSLDAVFLDINGTLTPFFVKQARLLNNMLTVAFEDVTTPAASEALVGCEAFLPLAALPQLDDSAFYFHEIPGFAVIDEVKGNIGTAGEVVDRLQQPVLVVGSGRNEILIPVAPGVIKKVDRAARELHIAAPEGLIDIYLGNAADEDEFDGDFNPFAVDEEDAE